jgi:protein-tyrosine phosphatase
MSEKAKEKGSSLMRSAMKGLTTSKSGSSNKEKNPPTPRSSGNSRVLSGSSGLFGAIAKSNSQSPVGNQDKKKKVFSTTGVIRGAVSKKKLRFQKDGFDLDLSYITQRIIAMGFPSTAVEGMYRNPIEDVQQFFTRYHKNRYRIYNLCSERSYPPEKFQSVARFPFDDHNPPAFIMIQEFCRDAVKHLRTAPDAVVAVHCKAGKGRTGLLISCLLLHLQICVSPAAALKYYGEQRTADGKGVTIASQQRYVRFYSAFLYEYALLGLPFPDEQPVALKRFSLSMSHPPPFAEWHPMVIISSTQFPRSGYGTEEKRESSAIKYGGLWRRPALSHDIDCNIPVRGDVKVWHMLIN